MRKYLQAEEKAVKKAEKAYRKALAELQKNCEHEVVLCHETDRYVRFRVCEGCGITCTTPWDSPALAVGEKSLMDRRSYEVSWSEFVNSTALVKPKGRVW